LDGLFKRRDAARLGARPSIAFRVPGEPDPANIVLRRGASRIYARVIRSRIDRIERKSRLDRPGGIVPRTGRRAQR
jgi:hypothetical protein